MQKSKFGIVWVLLLALIVVFAWLAYRQHQTIGVLNREIIEQAARRQKIILENYKLTKELERLKSDSAFTGTSKTKNAQPLKD